MTGFVQTFASFVLVLGILVLFHELGHFLVAKAFGIGVPVFSVGFGPRLFGFRRDGTDYRVSVVPLGGYVRLKGDEADEERSGAEDEFLVRPRWQRFLVFVAGATFNIVLAIIVAAAMFRLYGKTEVAIPEQYPTVADVARGSGAESAGVLVGDRIVEIAGRDARDPQTQVEEIVMSPGTVKDVVLERQGTRVTLRLPTGRDERYHLGSPGWFLRQESPGAPIVDMVLSGSPADRAGLLRGDRILGIDERADVGEIELRALIAASPGREIALAIEREGRSLTVPITPRDEDGKGRIGVQFKTTGLVRRDLDTVQAFTASLELNWDLTRNVFLTLRKVVRGEISVRAFSGPIEIARVSREAVRGFESFLGFMALISLQLGILNLLPIPVLDGGHILILTLEGVMRRDFSEKVKERVMQAGLVFLVAFFGIVIYFDVIKTWFSS